MDELDATNIVNKIFEFQEILKEDAEDRVVQKFPERIFHLSILLKKPEFCIAEMNIINSFDLLSNKVENNSNRCNGESSRKQPHLDSNEHDLKPEHTTVPTNKNIIDLINILKSNLRLLAEDTNALQIWVLLHKPEMEVGNNFGVAVQEQILTTIQAIHLDATKCYDKISMYYESRAKLVSKALLYPNLEDYRRAVGELDDRQQLSMSITLHDIRNHYTTLHDLVIKNFQKIVNPRSL